VSLDAVTDKMNSFLADLSKEGQDGDEVPRELVIITFDSRMEESYSDALDFDLFTLPNAQDCDLQLGCGNMWKQNARKGSRYHSNTVRNQRPSLEEYVCSVGLQAHGLHNGGNDTAVELRAAIAVANFTDQQLRVFGRNYQSPLMPSELPPLEDPTWPKEPLVANDLLPAWVAHTERGRTDFRQWLCFLAHDHPDSPACSFCKQRGHFAERCPSSCWGQFDPARQAKRSRRIVIEVSPCPTCYAADHSADAKNCPNASKCFNCGEPGHRKQDCLKCAYCKEQGHNIRDCTKVSFRPAFADDCEGSLVQCAAASCYTCGQEGHMARECILSKCGKCKGTGHVDSACPKPSCRRCYKVGHFGYECPEQRGGSGKGAAKNRAR